MDVDPARGAPRLSADEGSFAEGVGAHPTDEVSLSAMDFRVLNLHGVEDGLKPGITKMVVLHNKYNE